MKTQNLKKPVKSAVLPCPACNAPHRVIYSHTSFDKPNRMYHWHYRQTEDNQSICCTWAFVAMIPKGHDIATTKAISWRAL